MFNNSSTVTLVSALVGAGAYAQPLPAAAPAPISMQAVESIQRARVDIYCGHPLQALAHIRAASQQLRVSGATLSAATLAALDEAAWQTRRSQHVLAERSLDAALNQLALGAALA